MRGLFWKLSYNTNLLSGVLFVFIAILGFWLSRDLPNGTLSRMGTGYFPRLVCGGLLVMGLLACIQGIRSLDGVDEEAESLFAPAVIFIPLSLVLFGLALPRLGFVLSSAVMLVVGSLGSRGLGLVKFGGLMGALIASSVILFIWLLGLPIPVWPAF